MIARNGNKKAKGPYNCWKNNSNSNKENKSKIKKIVKKNI